MDKDLFFEKIDELSAGDKVSLKRSCGKMIQNADGRALTAFYKCLPYDVPAYQEDKWFACACFYCMTDEPGIQPIEKCFLMLKSSLKSSSDSIEGRITSLLDLSWDKDGYLLTKLSRLVKMLLQKGYTFDCKKLLNDLLFWDYSDRKVQRKWARTLCGQMPENKAEGE